MKSDKKGYVISKSQKYENKFYTYWWDITPNRKRKISLVGGIDFVQKDTGLCATVKAIYILRLLTPERKTNREKDITGGNWGIKVLAYNPDVLVIEEPGVKMDKWARITVKWE